MNSLVGQVAVVTGAARGIGEAISRRLGAMGAHVVLVARDADKLGQVQAAIAQAGGSAEVKTLDLRAPEEIEAFGIEVRQKHGRCDVLVNNAGVATTRQAAV